MHRRLSSAEYEQWAGREQGEEGKWTQPRYQPPTPCFLKEIGKVEHVRVGNQVHGAYIFNRPYLGEPARPPLLLCREYLPTASREGAAFMSTWAQQLQRPIVSIDLPGGGGESAWPRVMNARLSTIAKRRVEVLERLGITGRIDLAGVCIGGVVAAKMALELQDRAGYLATIFTPGLNMVALPGALCGANGPVMQDKKEAIQKDGVTLRDLQHLRSDPSATPAELLFPLVVGSQWFRLGMLANALHPKTRWYDLCGERDSRTSAQSHLRAVEDRNRAVPGSAAGTVIANAAHSWGMVRTVPIAWDIAKALQGK